MTDTQLIAELTESLRGVVRILEAVRYSVGLRGNQVERLDKARAAIAKAAERLAQE